MTDLLSHRLGTVTCTPDTPVVAGSYGQWTLVYTVGSYGVDEHGTIILVQRLVSDWEVPQFDRPDASGFTTVTTSGEARLGLSYQRKAYKRPWTAGLVIDVYDGSLAPGDIVTIVLGDRSQGSPGIRAQTFRETAHEFRLLVDATNAHVVRRVPTSPLFPIVSGEAVRLVCTVPSQAVVGEPIEVFVKGEDAWGNPTSAPAGASLEWIGGGSATLRDNRLTLAAPGHGHVRATATQGGTTLSCRSNPLTVHADEPTLKRYWGDLHAQTSATVGTGTEEEYFAFGRDIARLDFTSHQGNDFQMTDEDWQRLNDVVREFHQDGQFVVFPGYEWSANTPAGGDRNVFYLEEGLPILRSKHWQIPETPEDALTPAHPADVLFTRMRENVPLEKVLMGSHVGGRYADIHRYFDQELGPLVEVVSCWGVFEWLLWDAFDMGYIVGVMCNSDGHKGRPGAEGPGAGEFGINSGLTCVLAESLSREAIFAALKERRCYGTTGARIDLAFEIDGNPMGSVIERAPEMRVEASVRGTAPLESLQLYRGRQIIETVQPAAFAQRADSNQIRVSWQGSRIRGRGRRVAWDGAIRVEGATILSATPHSFDSPADGIIGQSTSEITFRSGTTGDVDGIDLVLDVAQTGRLHFESQAGSCSVDLAELATERACFDFGGLDIGVCVERYPTELVEVEAALSTIVRPPAGKSTPYFVKAIQSDGQMAWSSPIYVQ